MARKKRDSSDEDSKGSDKAQSDVSVEPRPQSSIFGMTAKKRLDQGGKGSVDAQSNAGAGESLENKM
ncbi:hypothetical protein NL533_36570, partial [Klebsiella pneumoniae]|nr:hypothetical protein [Klebsiella pneumoniae]